MRKPVFIFLVFLNIFVINSLNVFAGLLDPLSKEEKNKIIEQIKSNNIDQLKEDSDFYMVNKKSDMDFLSIALNPPGCRDNVVNYIINTVSMTRSPLGGSWLTKPTESQLQFAISNDCNKVVSLLIPKFDSKTIAHVTMSITIPSYVIDDLNNKTLSQESVSFFDNFVNISIENKKYCDENKQENCKALAHLKDISPSMLAIEDMKHKEAVKETKDQYLITACQDLQYIKGYQRQIADQKEIGQTSGVVDKETLYEAGAQIQANRREIAKIKADYLKLYHKNLDLSQCSRLVTHN